MKTKTDLMLFLDKLDSIAPENKLGQFSNLFDEGCFLLEFNDVMAAAVFDTTVPIIGRWRSGFASPPAATLVLRFLKEEICAKIKSLSE
jgi:hypothetical protein